jgi:predicted O-methyltransferase YrrM
MMSHPRTISGFCLGVFVLVSCFVDSADPVAGQRAKANRGSTEAVELKPGEFAFTKNWTDRYTDNWSKHLEHLKGKPGLKMLEVGTFEGRSAIWFLDNILTHPTSQFTSVDIYRREGSEERFDHNMQVSGHADKLNKLEGYSQIVLRSLEPNSFDLIYIDGCHKAACVYMDIAYSWDLLKRDGILIFDDYLFAPRAAHIHRPKVPIDAFLTSFENVLETLHKDWQIILRKKELSPWHAE